MRNKRADERARAWYKENVKDPKALDKKIEATLDYLKRFDEPDMDGEWNLFAYEIVDGHHGQYTIRIFLDEVLGSEAVIGEGTFKEMEDLDEIMDAYDTTSKEVARVFKQNSKLDGKFYMGTNEADGSLGVFYSVRA